MDRRQAAEAGFLGHAVSVRSDSSPVRTPVERSLPDASPAPGARGSSVQLRHLHSLALPRQDIALEIESRYLPPVEPVSGGASFQQSGSHRDHAADAREMNGDGYSARSTFAAGTRSSQS